ncbi:MAG: prolipoprotein diacylglyceryl transferase [Chloroflexi bacterium HGW-Chloroflexi-10]|nr:MAG: prolipoprotein diacylglyceryl transferase [Chloroflexi bacterium HGW-Chloroflexi-10]
MIEGFYIGPLFIHFYGVIIMFGAVLAAWLSTKEAKRRGLDPELVWDLMPWLLILGIVGARIWHILTPPASMVEMGITTQYYLTHPLDALNVRNGGLGIPGGVMGGALALFLYVRKKKMSFGMWVDIIAPGLALAQAVGRWGNFVNQELYGAPTDLPWAIFIAPTKRLPEYIDQAYYHPMFLYESLWNLLIMIVLLVMGRKLKNWLLRGDIFLFYLVLYPAARFLLEFIRLDPSNLGGLNANQTLMGIIVILSVVGLVVRHTVFKEKIQAAELAEMPGSKPPSVAS